MCACVSVCQDVCPDDLTIEDRCHTNSILQVHCWGCLFVQVMFHALMTSLMTSQDHKVGQILKLIYVCQYLSYNVDQKLKMSEMLMAISLVNSTSGITSVKNSSSRAINGGHFENFEILNTPSIWQQIWRDRPKLCQNLFFKMMTSSMTSQGGLKVGPLYSFINKITTFFMITKKRAKILSLNLLCIGIMKLWLHLNKCVFMTSLMTSPGHRVGQIFSLI